MSIPKHDPIYGRWYLLALAPGGFHGVFNPSVSHAPPFRECSLNDLYAYVRKQNPGDSRLTIPQAEMEGYYKSKGWAIYKIDGENLLRVA